MRPLSPLLESVERPRDASAIAWCWAGSLSAYRGKASLPVVNDVTWMDAAVQRAKHSDESSAFEPLMVPFWAISVRHTQAEGFFFVSGKQYEALALVPASAAAEGTLLLESGEPLSQAVASAIAHVQAPRAALRLGYIGDIDSVERGS
jgi:hypothetical protein